MAQSSDENPNRRAAREVVERLRSLGHEALWVGGCVRDLLLGAEPEDYDVATSALPEQVERAFPHTVPVGAKFGVILVVLNGVPVQVATFRAEEDYSDHRRPDAVRFCDARTDSQRRDFTMNGLFMDPATGRVDDYVGGQADIQRQIIRSIGDPDKRFSEDALRLLRAVRFASSLGFEIEPGTWDSLVRHAPLIREISAERIRDELLRGLTRPRPHIFLDLLDRSGLLLHILPEVSALKGCEQPPQFHPEGDVFVHTRLMLQHLKPNPSPSLALAVLLHDIAKPVTRSVTDRVRFNNHHKVGADMADAICRRLVLPNDLRERVVQMVLRHMDFINLGRMRESTLRRFLASPSIEDEVELHRVDCLASHGDLQNYEFAQQRLNEYRAERPGAMLPPPLITGEDLIAAGLQPGPAFGRILAAVQDAQLEQRVTTPAEALELAKCLASNEKPGTKIVDCDKKADEDNSDVS
ncbi:MAG: CCA tRNA nucleotidyltransferase [Candidatus Sumerlaeaceae bacterium]|nr:CCA tRNA nucleotidyltransferase [Candidatus Sumerlaeaceae bacterium]